MSVGHRGPSTYLTRDSITTRGAERDWHLRTPDRSRGQEGPWDVDMDDSVRRTTISGVVDFSLVPCTSSNTSVIDLGTGVHEDLSGVHVCVNVRPVTLFVETPKQTQ